MNVPFNIEKEYKDDLTNKVRRAENFCLKYDIQTKNDFMLIKNGLDDVIDLIKRGIFEFK